jgi:NAD(P)-dependent dehydrogenase (short-subunit alcohol dehydrogenase family)
MRGWSIPAAYRFKSQPHRERSCNLQIAIELQRSAGRVAPFGMAKIDFDVITDIAAKCKIDGKPRVLHADIDAGSAEDQPHDSEFRAARRMKSVVDQVNKLGQFDAVIHNAGIGYQEPKLVKTVDGLPQLFAVNTLAPYILTALITLLKRLVYLSSGMHYGAGSHLDDILWEKRRWNGSQAYAETKFQDVLLAFAVARLFPGVKSNSLEPGWVPTKMGGAGAPDDIDQAHRTQVWLATSDEPAAAVSGRYFFHQKLRDPDPTTKDVERQSLLLDLCYKASGTALPKP